MLIEIAIPDCPPTIRLLCAPPFPDVNTVYRAGATAFLEPRQLAIDCGKMSDKGAERLYAMVYAEGVILSSPTEGFEGFSRPDWTAWLIEHPVHFQKLRDCLDHRKNWEEPDESGGTEDGGQARHPDTRAASQSGL